MRARDLFAWKFYFHDAFLPALARLRPETADAVLDGLGRASLAWNPDRRRRFTVNLSRAKNALGARAGDWDVDAIATALGGGVLRFLARDYRLDTGDDARALATFEVDPAQEQALRDALDAGKGAVLVGSHLGGHVAAFHWLYRRGLPVRLMVQRPKHVASALKRFFDRDEGTSDPQSGYFLSRGLNPTECVNRLLRCRSALKAGKAVYLPGDVPWSGPNTRPGRLLGVSHRVLSVWADLASITGAPVFFVFCTHAPGGRHALSLESAGPIAPGGEGAAVARFLGRLDDAIAARPADAVAHLLWPCYGPPRPEPAVASPTRAPRPGRRASAAWHP